MLALSLPFFAPRLAPRTVVNVLTRCALVSWNSVFQNGSQAWLISAGNYISIRSSCYEFQGFVRVITSLVKIPHGVRYRTSRSFSLELRPRQGAFSFFLFFLPRPFSRFLREFADEAAPITRRSCQWKSYNFVKGAVARKNDPCQLGLRPWTVIISTNSFRFPTEGARHVIAA